MEFRRQEFESQFSNLIISKCGLGYLIYKMRVIIAIPRVHYKD